MIPSKSNFKLSQGCALVIIYQRVASGPYFSNVVNGSMAKDVREETLMHEILHTMLDNSGIEEVSRQVKEGANLSELVATILAPRLHALLKENKLENIIESI